MPRPLLFPLVSLSLVFACSSSEPATPSVTGAGGDGGVTFLDAGSDDGANPEADAATDAGPNDADATDATSCTLRPDDGGAPLTPPAPLVTAMNAAAPGDVVSLSGMNESAAPTLAVSVCPSPSAPTLLFSDSPEAPTADGILYADTVDAGRYRLYVYQANGASAQRKFPVVVFNPTTAAAKVKILRRGLAAASTQYVSVGKTVLLDFLADKSLPEVTVPPGQRVLLDSSLDAIHAQKDELVHAIFDIETDAQLKLTFVSIGANGDAVTSTAGFTVLAPDANHQRGTFPNAEITITAQPSAQKSGVQRMRLGNGEIDATLDGLDRTFNPAKPQKLLGNYGLLYRIELNVPTTARAGISARGGAWGGVVRNGATTVALPSNAQTLATTTDAIVLGAITSTTKLELLSAGGSNLPIDLFLVTP